MTQEFLFSTVYNLCAKDLPGKGFQFFDRCYLSSNEKLLKSCFSKMAIHCVGGCEHGAALREGVFVYSELPDRCLTNGHELPTLALKAWLQVVRTFFLALWFVKDNAVDCELGFARYLSETGQEMYTTNYIAALNFDANSHRHKIDFSLEELRAARALFQDEILPFIMPETFGNSGFVPNLPSPKAVHKELPRLTRFLYFLSGSRIQDDVCMRLSQYMTSLEVLFSTDNSELVYKLSERIAFFLGEDASSRRTIYGIIRNAYKIRSKVVHGDPVAAKDIEKARNTSNEVDQIVRQIGLKILRDSELKARFNGKKEDLEQYFLGLVIG